MVAVAGYSYTDFCRGIYERDGNSCWVRGLLIGRREAKIKEWGAGQGHGLTPTEQGWIPNGLLECDGPLDGHHVGLSKSWLKREYGHYAEIAAMLNDPRNGVCVCRRHHDMLEAHLIAVRRGELPEDVEEFAAELGMKAVARLERDFGRVSPVGSAQARST